MGFRNSVVGGTTLVRPAIKSPNYVTGVSGWSINADGSAEFNDIVIRGGTVIGGTALYYDGTPTTGNLIMSISADAGTDPFGNAYVSGVGVYGDSDTVTAISDTGDQVQLRADATSYVADSTSPGIQFTKATETGVGASITEYDDTFDLGLGIASPSPVVGGSAPDDFAFIQMVGAFSSVTQIQMYAKQVNMLVDSGGEVLATGTIIAQPQSSTAVGFIANNPSGSTGALMSLRVDGDSQFTVDVDGVLATYADNAFTTYTPVVTGGGAVTWTTRTGWWQRVGKMIYFTAYLVVNGAGSGGTAVSVTGPQSIDRTTRQIIPAHGGGLGGPGSGEYTALCATGGSGATIDRLTRGGTDLTGANLSAGATITIEGWYREA